MASPRGFTLPEVALVMTIVAIGAVLAVPAYQGWTARTDLRQSASELNSTLTLARVAAMSRNQIVSVTLSQVGGRVQVTTGGLINASTMGSHVESFTVTGDPPPSVIAFNSLGLRADQDAGNKLITLTNDQGVTYSVVVTPGGKVEWCAAGTCP